jgi:hypothetical protein
LWDFYEKVCNLKYSDALTLANSINRANTNDYNSDLRQFCIELVINAYKHIGIITSTKPSSNAKLVDVLCIKGDIHYYNSDIVFGKRIYYSRLSKLEKKTVTYKDFEI